MGIINIYNTISNEHSVIHANGVLKDIIPDFDFKHSIILKAGNKLNSDYIVNPEDVIYMRIVPRGIGAALITAIAVVVIGGASYGYMVNKNIQQQQEQAQRDAKNLAQQVQQLPFIKGARNTNALGNTIQYIMGDVYNTPYKLTDGFYSVGGTYGEESFYNLILCCGFGNQQIKNILIGSDSIIKNDDGIQSGIIDFNNESLHYKGKLELCQNGENFSFEPFTQKVICTQDGAEIKHDFKSDPEEIIRTLSDFTQKVEVCIQFNGLRFFDTEGETHGWKPRQATVKIYWTNKENPQSNDWEEFYFEGMNHNSISLNTNKTIRFVAKKTFTAEEAYNKTIKIKLVKTTPKLESNTNEDCYLTYYQSFCYDNTLSNSAELVPCKPLEDKFIDKTTRLAIQIIANENTSDTLEEIHTEACGLAKDWNGSKWTENKVPTRNPASWIREIITSDAHNHSKIPDYELDLASLQRVHKYCFDNGFYTDGVITSSVKKRDLITTILNNINCAMIINNEGKYEFVIDDIEDTPVALINAENIKSISYSKDLSRKPDGVKATFTNRNNWMIDTFYSMVNNPRTEDSVLTELNLQYVTDYNHAYKITQRKIRQALLQPKEIIVDVGAEGDYYPLYSTIMLQYPAFRQGLNSSVISGFIQDNNYNFIGIKISDAVIFENNINYGIIIQAQDNNGLKHYSKKVTGTGKTRELLFDSPIPFTADVKPSLGNICSFGELDEFGNFSKITNIMKIMEIKPSNSDGYALTLKDYNPEIYSYGEIPEYKSNLTQPPKPIKLPPKPPAQGVQGARGENGSSAFNYLQIISTPEELPDSTNGDFFLCGKDFIIGNGNIVINDGDFIAVNDEDILGVEIKFNKGSVYYSRPDGSWKELKDRNDYRYTVAINDLYLIGEKPSPIFEEKTSENVYEGMGLDALETPEIVDREKRLLKVDLIDTDEIKAKQGFFDEIVSRLGTFIDATITGVMNARVLNFTNIKAGDEILRAFKNIDSSKTNVGYSQICGTGTVRIKAKLLSLYSLSINNAYVKVSSEKASKTITFENIGETNYVDIDIDAGDSIKFELAYFSGGVVSSFMNADIYICTERENGVLAYLGSYGLSSSKPWQSR